MLMKGTPEKKHYKKGLQISPGGLILVVQRNNDKPGQ